MGRLLYVLKRIKSMDKKAMLSAINAVHKETGMSRLKIFNDMRQCAVKYGAGYMDYNLFEMYNLTPEQRDTYLTRGRNNELVVKYCDKSKLHAFMNKDEFNNIFNEYIKRDWLKVNEVSKEEIEEFTKKHGIFMLKPIDGGCGKGIEKINVADYSDFDALYKYLNENGQNAIIEELIVQDSSVAKINPYSINTVRVVTIVTTQDGKSLLEIPEDERKDVKLKSHIICAYFRIGNNKKCVDNFNSGGMVAPVDEKTGIVSQVAIDKNKVTYINHPETNSPIKGFKFPYWEQVLTMCKEASLKIPEMGYAGWDIAFTPNGPVIVEGNEFPGHDIYQLPEHTPDKIGMMGKFDFSKEEVKV